MTWRLGGGWFSLADRKLSELDCASHSPGRVPARLRGEPLPATARKCKAATCWGSLRAHGTPKGGGRRRQAAGQCQGSATPVPLPRSPAQRLRRSRPTPEAQACWRTAPRRAHSPSEQSRALGHDDQPKDLVENRNPRCTFRGEPLDDFSELSQDWHPRVGPCGARGAGGPDRLERRNGAVLVHGEAGAGKQAGLRLPEKPWSVSGAERQPVLGMLLGGSGEGLARARLVAPGEIGTANGRGKGCLGRRHRGRWVAVSGRHCAAASATNSRCKPRCSAAAQPAVGRFAFAAAAPAGCAS